MMDVAEQEYMKQSPYLLLYNQGYARQYQPFLLIIVPNIQLVFSNLC